MCFCWLPDPPPKKKSLTPPPPPPFFVDLLNIFLPFFALTSAVGVVYGVERTDLNTRLTVLGSFFIAHLSLRFVSGQYLPRISYSTQLDTYVQLCLLFVLAAVVEAVVASQASVFGASPSPSQKFEGGLAAWAAGTVLNASLIHAPSALDDATVVVPCAWCVNATPLTLDAACWLALLVAWLCTNFYYSQFFLGKYVAAASASHRKRLKRMQRAAAGDAGAAKQIGFILETVFAGSRSSGACWRALGARLLTACFSAASTAACCASCEWAGQQ